MQLVKPSIEHLDVTTDPLKAIEIAGRTCYKSEDKITDDSAEKFVKMLLKREHHAMIEHSNFILGVDASLYDDILKVEDRQYIRMSKGKNGSLVSGNPRALRDFCLRPDIDSHIQRQLALVLCDTASLLYTDVLRYTEHLKYMDKITICRVRLVDPDDLSRSEKLKHQVASYKIVCNRGFTHELVRHRPFSYAQESTRYCNYKGGVSFIIPPWLDVSEGDINLTSHPELGEIIENADDAWVYAMQYAESRYKSLIEDGQKPQQARGVLPIDLKTEIVVTGNLQQWRTFFGLRCTPKRAPKEDLINGIWYHATAPHPQMQEIANMILADMKMRVPGIFDEIGVQEYQPCSLCRKLNRVGAGCVGNRFMNGCVNFQVID